MRRQRGGRVFYTARYFKRPEEIEFTLRERPAFLIPSQTGGQCATDSAIAILFYADGVRQILWDWVYKNAPGGDIQIPDEALEIERLRTSIPRMTKVFLLTVAARVLRILESYADPSLRSASFSPSEETEETTPSEVCSNLGITLIRMLRVSSPGLWDTPPGPATPITLISPGSRTTGVDYGTSTSPENFRALLRMLARVFLRTPEVVRNIGAIDIQRQEPADELVAINMSLIQIASEEAEEGDINRTIGHAISLIRLQNKWYIADNNVGRLVEMPMPPEVIPLLEDPAQVYFQMNYMSETPTELGTAEFFIRKRSDRTILAKTPVVSRLKGGVAPGVRPVGILPRRSHLALIMRESHRYPRRIPLFWKRGESVPVAVAPERNPPPVTLEARPGAPVGDSDGGAGPAAAGAGPPARLPPGGTYTKGGLFFSGGVRRTRRVRRTKRKRRTTRASKARLSSPK